MAILLRCHCGLSSSSSSSHLRKQPLSEVTLGGEGRRVTRDSPKEKEKSMEVPKKWSFCANDLAISRVSPLRFVGEKSSNNPFALSYSTPLWRNGPFGFNRHPSSIFHLRLFDCCCCGEGRDTFFPPPVNDAHFRQQFTPTCHATIPHPPKRRGETHKVPEEM